MKKLGNKYSIWQVVSDFVEMQALLISILYDPVHREKRAKQYDSMIEKYDMPSRQLLSEAIKVLGEMFTDNVNCGYYEDILGILFHDLELHNKYKGQFFTPQDICRMMCEVSISDNDIDVNKKGYVSVMEPASGSGAMMLSFADTMHHKGYNPKTQLCALAVDVDYKCACMAYIQLSMYGIPAVVLHGDSLLVKEYSRWYTPVYILDKWVFREKMGFTTKCNESDELLKMVTDPIYKAFRSIEYLTRKKEYSKTETQEKVTSKFDYKIEENGQISLF